METNAVQTNAQPTDPSGAIVFDSTSGISLEEQQEILAGINAMTGGSRLVSEAAVPKAKKRGFLFPLFVNIGAVILLVAGFLLLSHFHVQEEQGIRESYATLGLTERALIQEIRQETSRQLRAKENEINSILLLLSTVDAEYRLLQDSLEILTDAQQQRAAALLLMQEEYRTTLSGLQEERASIIEDSRVREVVLRAQAEERTRDLAARVEQSEVHLSAAMEELRLLSAEHERAARAESQMGAYYAAANSHIGEGRLDEASATLRTMREFLAAPSLQGIRTVEARRQTHLTAISALEGAVAEARRLTSAIALLEGGAVQPPLPVNGPQDGALAQALEDLAELNVRYAALGQQLEAQGLIITATGDEQARLIAEHAGTIAGLQTENQRLNAANTTQQQTLATQQQTLTAQQATLNQRASEIQTLTGENTGLRNQVQATAARAEQSEAALEEQARQYAVLSQQKDELQDQFDELQQRLEAALRLFQ